MIIRQLDEHKELLAAQRLYESIWRSATPPMTAELMRALLKSGNYVAGAFDGEDLVGACAAFCSPPAESSLHSHIAGVAPGMRGRDIGHALKLDQREWALARGIKTITWTFDPLVRRNAHFNLAKLGADATDYVPDLYGPMSDDINSGGESDRLLVTWDLTAARPRGVSAAGVVGLGISADGLPVPGTTAGHTVLVAVPPDIETLRATNPAAANEWRHAVRDVLGGLLAAGARVTGFDRSGWYVVERNDAS
ncbi:putative GNAT superfamily acetyltransferase [Lentzea atacamensis]|uniref:N-acetyltransferase domain-containing protein n=2 Tax=Lentzea TaxID=165301 RepID=A0ABP7A301_9PSEU|nr:GNAT family N-acetyltransferase [Lentzea atacamensis]PWK83661.1 putative GNAT superfamily acetyltransferase [Lentzea atacamensis]